MEFASVLNQSRKRSASTPYPRETPSPGDESVESIGVSLKRTKTDNELDALGIIPQDEAWHFDVASVIASPPEPQAHTHLKSYSPSKSLFVLCVVGGLELHYQLLWYAMRLSLHSILEI